MAAPRHRLLLRIRLPGQLSDDNVPHLLNRALTAWPGQPGAAGAGRGEGWLSRDDGASDVAWQRFHDPDEPMFLLGAYVDGKLTGIVQYLFHRSSWTPGNYCYLQDLFVAEGARGLGLGRALIEAVYEKAKAAGLGLVALSQAASPPTNPPNSCRPINQTATASAVAYRASNIDRST